MNAVRVGLLKVPGVAAELADKVGVIAGEVEPFIEAAARVLSSPQDTHAAHEARSLAWLMAYRLGDQGFAALAPVAVLHAWRGCAGEGAPGLCDTVMPLLLDGYARGREDRARAEVQAALAAALPVSEIAPGVLLVVVAGPLDPDGARTLAERAGSAMLRGDARAVLLEVSALSTPSAAVLVELWGVVSAARMLGAASVVSASSAAVMQAMKDAPPPEGTRCATKLSDAVEQALRAAGVSAGADGIVSWVKRVVGRR